MIDNLCKWDLYFPRANGVGDIRIPGGAKRYAALDVAEVRWQIQLNNKMFTGTDGVGGHARLRITDDAQRNALFNLRDGENAPDAVALTREAVVDLLAINNKKKFHERLAALVKTPAEKRMILNIVKEVDGEGSVAAWKMDAINAVSDENAL